MLKLGMVQHYGNNLPHRAQVDISASHAGQEIYLRRPLRYGLPDDMAVTFAQAGFTADVLC